MFDSYNYDNTIKKMDSSRPEELVAKLYETGMTDDQVRKQLEDFGLSRREIHNLLKRAQEINREAPAYMPATYQPAPEGQDALQRRFGRPQEQPKEEPQKGKGGLFGGMFGKKKEEPKKPEAPKEPQKPLPAPIPAPVAKEVKPKTEKKGVFGGLFGKTAQKTDTAPQPPEKQQDRHGRRDEKEIPALDKSTLKRLGMIKESISKPTSAQQKKEEPARRDRDFKPRTWKAQESEPMDDEFSLLPREPAKRPDETEDSGLEIEADQKAFDESVIEEKAEQKEPESKKAESELEGFNWDEIMRKSPKAKRSDFGQEPIEEAKVQQRSQKAASQADDETKDMSPEELLASLLPPQEEEDDMDPETVRKLTDGIDNLEKEMGEIKDLLETLKELNIKLIEIFEKK